MISFDELLKHFFNMHAYQYESKPQYMSAIFYLDDAQKASAEKFIASLEAKRGRVATKVLPASQWWDAEEYHQNYHAKNRAMW